MTNVRGAWFKDKSGDRKYFTIIPNLLWPDIRRISKEPGLAITDHIDELGVALGIYDKWLYTTIKKICGPDGGECFLSTRSLAKMAGMSAGKVSSGKVKLAKAGLIDVIAKKRSASGQPIDHITILDVMPRNIEIEKARAESVHLVNPSSDEHKDSPHEHRGSPGETEEEPMKKNQEEEITDPPPEKPQPNLIAPDKDDQAVIASIIEQTETHPGPCDLARKAVAAQEKAGGNYAIHSSAGGDDGLAALGLFCLYDKRGKRPPKQGTKTYCQQREKISEALRAYDYQQAQPELIEKAAELLCERKADWVNPYYKSFIVDFGAALSDAEYFIKHGRLPESAQKGKSHATHKQIAPHAAARTTYTPEEAAPFIAAIYGDDD